MVKIEITKEEFKAYENIRSSGVTNMFNVTMVISLSGGVLDKEKCLNIMDNYDGLYIKFMRDDNGN